jgi:cysteinyl-tRNA synthetase
MDDDFNTAKAVAILFDLDREINQRRSEGFTVEEAQKTLIELAGVLGLTLKEELARAIPSTELIELLISVRDRLRAEQNWALADDIRSRLRELGIILEDTAKGTVWRYNRR